jgi:hypothetical protein
VLQLDTQVPFVHAIVPLAGAAAQTAQNVPHPVTEVVDTHWPEQTWLPEGHDAARHCVPLHAKVLAFVGQSAQTPPHSL